MRHVDVKTQKETSESFQSSENFEPPQAQRAPNFELPQPMDYAALPSIQLSQHSLGASCGQGRQFTQFAKI